MLFMIIDDDPTRYSEFSDLILKRGHRYVITCDLEIAEQILDRCSDARTCILLDHDMPINNGKEFAKMIASKSNIYPVIITSTTSIPNAREDMLSILDEANISCVINPADHINCEVEWYWWAKGYFDSIFPS
jgi:FixJ family two-component response regulator